MNKNELITKVADSSRLSKTDAGSAVDSVIESIVGALKAGDDVRLSDLVRLVYLTGRQVKVVTREQAKKLIFQPQSSRSLRQVKA